MVSVILGTSYHTGVVFPGKVDFQFVFWGYKNGLNGPDEQLRLTSDWLSACFTDRHSADRLWLQMLQRRQSSYLGYFNLISGQWRGIVHFYIQSMVVTFLFLYLVLELWL